jgi:hypothetical protein
MHRANLPKPSIARDVKAAFAPLTAVAHLSRIP